MKKSIINFKYSIIALIMIVLNGVGAHASTPWTINPSEYRYDMSLYLDVELANVKMDYSQYDVAVFAGDQCRGIAEVLSFDGDKQCLYLRARSNQESGEVMTFKYHNRETGEIVSIDGSSFQFKSNDRLGYPSEPYIIKIVKHYSVSLSANEGGSVSPESGKYAENSVLELVATPSEGYHFNQWSDGNKDNPRSVVVNSDITLKAEFEISSFKVVFKIGEEIVESKVVKFGQPIVTPNAPVKEGYTFDGWKDVPETMPAHDIEILGSYTINSYKLLYKVDGEIYKEFTLDYGTTIVAESNPEKEGHTFSGWDSVPPTMPAHDVTVSGTFSINSYNAVFKIGEEVIETKTVVYGQPVVAPEAPAKEGYTFDGWKDVPETMPAHDIEILGSYTINSYKLLYKVDGEIYKEFSLDYGTTIVAEPNPEKEGHTFSGWDSIPSTMPAHDVTVSGTFSINSYNAVFKIGEDVIETKAVVYGQPVVAPEAPAKEGYTFDGWKDVPETMPAHDIEILGSYTINSYKLMYKVDGEIYKEFTLDYGTTIVAEPNPEKEGHTFSGWDSIPSTMPAHDVTVSGTFSINSYNAVFKIGEDVIETKAIVYGQPVVAPEAPAKEGYTFDRWKDVPETMPAHDIEILGSYTINSYKLLYKVDGEIYKEYTLNYGTTIVAEPNPEKEGYTFSGWDSVPSTMPAHDVTVIGTFSINSYNAVFKIGEDVIEIKAIVYGQPVIAPEAPAKGGYTFDGWKDVPETMPAHDIEILGSYTINSYKLLYKVDGESYKEYTLDYGTTIVAEPNPEKEGHTFSGWDSIPSTMPAHDVTVSGTFSINSYNAVFKIGEDVIETKAVVYGQPVVAPEAPAREGYTFDGWKDVPETMPAHDIEILGSYTVNLYKLTYIIDGEVYRELDVEYDADIQAENPEKEGYTFSGWDNLPEKMPAHDVTVIGSFTVNSYNLNLYLNDQLFHTELVNYGEKLQIADPSVPDGNKFDGWVTVIPETMPAHDLDIYGTYSDISRIEDILFNSGKQLVICDINGNILYRNVVWNDICDQIQNGLYIINGVKYLIIR